jgi:ribosomal protein S6--L-glutamate ligase
MQKRLPHAHRGNCGVALRGAKDQESGEGNAGKSENICNAAEGSFARQGDPLRLSLGKRMRASPSFHCHGVQPNWDDYADEVKEAIVDAREIFYPSPLYEDIFRSLGKATYPRNYYSFLGNKIRQTSLFQLLGISHPRTRIYYGRNRLTRICRDFPYPFVAKTPVGSSRGYGVYLIQCEVDLANYLQDHRPAYTQEYLPLARDLRVVLIKGRVVHAYWRIHQPGEFRNNVAQGGEISFDDIPSEALDFAADVARQCGFEEVGLDICRVDGRYYVIEANMVFGLEGFRRRGLDLCEVLCNLEEKGLL